VADYKDLALNLKKILEDEVKRKEFAERSYSLFFEKFTAKENARNVFEVYSKQQSEEFN
jgi:glycosyltransferase involved in cell wall biosynthesis